MKSKQELKKVFENGDKPRQEDFWEWQDSYWHKEDSIPIEKIEELKNSLDLKANVDASNINTETWQSKLELDQKILTSIDGLNYTWSPTNRTLTLSDGEGNQISQVSLLSLDNEGTDLRYNSSTASLELWNAYNELLDTIPVSSFIGSVGTQLQLNSNQLQLKDSQGNILSTVSFAVSNINGLQTVLDGKLSKPSTIGNTTSYPYVIGEDGSGNSARLPAGDLGKNFFNADLSNTSARNHTMNAGLTINTLGNVYKVQNLPDRSTDSNFNKVIKTDSTGQFALGDAFVYNVPNTITVNHVNQPSDPDVPVYVQTIKDKLNEIHNSAIFQKFTNWNIETFNGISDETINIQNNDTIQTNVNPFRSLTTAVGGQTMINVKSTKILSSSQNWAITFNSIISTDGASAYGNYGIPGCRYVGIYSDDNGLVVPDFYFRDGGGGDFGIPALGLSGDNTQGISTRQVGWYVPIKCLILKVGTQIFLQAGYGTNNIISKIYDIQNLVNNNSNFGFIVSAYKIVDNSNPYTTYSANVSNIQYTLLT